jgi:hypothetical protein
VLWDTLYVTPFSISGKTTLLRWFGLTMPMKYNKEGTFTKVIDDNMSDALLNEEMTKPRPVILLDQPPSDLKKSDNFIDGCAEGFTKRNKHNPSQKKVKTNIFFNWGDYRKDLEGFSTSLLSKGVFIFFEYIFLDEQQLQEMEAIDQEIMSKSKDFTSIFQLYIKEIDIAIFRKEKSAANTEIRKRLRQMYAVDCMTRVSDCYALCIAGFKAFCRNADMEVDIAKNLVEELLNYFVKTCIPRVIAKINGAHVTPSKKKMTILKPVVQDLNGTIVKKIKESSTRFIFENIGFVKNQVYFLTNWLEDFGEYLPALKNTFGSCQKDRKYFLDSESEEVYFQREGNGFKYGKGKFQPCLVVPTKDVPLTILQVLCDKMKGLGIDLKDDLPLSAISYSTLLRDHYEKMYCPTPEKIAKQKILDNVIKKIHNKTKDMDINEMKTWAHLFDEQDKDILEEDEDVANDFNSKKRKTASD